MSKNCDKCERPARAVDAVFCRGGCGKVFHAKCLDLSDYDVTTLSKKKFVKILCDKCEEKLKSVELLEESVKDNKKTLTEYVKKAEKIDLVVESIKDIKDTLMEYVKKAEQIDLIIENVKKISEWQKTQEVKIAKILEEVGSNSVISTDKTQRERNEPLRKDESYADQLKKPSPAVIVKPKAKQSAVKTKQEVKNKIDPTELKVKGVQSVSKGAIVISCENEEARNKTKSEIEGKMSDKYDVRVPILRKPKIKVCGLSEEWNESDLIEKLCKQNDFIDKNEIKFITSYKTSKKFNPINVILEVNGENLKNILRYGKVNIGWDRCIVFEEANVLRCYNCQGFNHKATNCKYEKSCPRCMGQHDIRDCKEVAEQCINCLKANERLNLKLNCEHDARSRECQVYLRKLKKDRMSVEY